MGMTVNELRQHLDALAEDGWGGVEVVWWGWDTENGGMADLPLREVSLEEADNGPVVVLFKEHLVGGHQSLLRNLYNGLDLG